MPNWTLILLTLRWLHFRSPQPRLCLVWGQDCSGTQGMGRSLKLFRCRRGSQNWVPPVERQACAARSGSLSPLTRPAPPQRPLLRPGSLRSRRHGRAASDQHAADGGVSSSGLRRNQHGQAAVRALGELRYKLRKWRPGSSRCQRPHSSGATSDSDGQG
jgi:hypothetical protein